MSWFERLTELVKINLNIKIDNSVKLHINNNSTSKPFEYIKEKDLLLINLTKLLPTDFEKCGKIVREGLNEGTAFLEKKAQERISDIKSKEASPDVQQLLTYFQDKIPPSDFAVLRQAVYIKKSFEEGLNSEVIYKLKGEVIRRYGQRGLNICNLYNSGYFVTMIKPLYEEIKKQGFDKNVFFEKYDVVINEKAFAVFVSGNMTLYDVKSNIENKIKRNVKYGVRTVRIHGIGKNNVSKVIEVISELEKKNPVIKKEMEVKGNIIYAKLLL